LETILASHEDFLLGKWIYDAKSLAGSNVDLSLYYEFEARNQVTRWGPRGEIEDYATKQWSGLVSSYYAVRWRIWLTEVCAAYEAHRSVDEKAVKAAWEGFEVSWQFETISYPIEPHGDTIAISKRILLEFDEAKSFLFMPQIAMAEK
jgi:alpha-N-acetylglucosaminidase